MSTEWIAPFQQHISEIDRLIGLLAEVFQAFGEGKNDQENSEEHLRSIVYQSVFLTTWAQALPRDDEFWAYIGPSDLFHQMRIYHGNLLRDLYYFFDARGAFIRAPHPETVGIMAVRDHLQATLRIMNDVRKAAYKRSRDQMDMGLPHHCPPSVIINELCLCTYSRELMQLPTSFQMQGWPLVQYHPDIHDLLHVLATWLWNPDNATPLHLAVRQTAPFCKIILTGADFHITPDRWHSFISHDFSQLETLRSIGGEIDPLTWDEGQGEGVIVRLPWMKDT